MFKSYLHLPIVASGVLIFFAILKRWDLDVLQKIFSIIGSLSIIFALATYLYKKYQDQTLAAIDQIAFFREKVVIEGKRTIDLIKKHAPDYWFSRIELDEFTFESVRKNFSRNLDNQISLFFDPTRSNWREWVNVEILDNQILYLNILEEFSLRVINTKTYNHEALNTIRAAFVEVVEQNIAAMLFVRYITNGNSIYLATLKLYRFWKPGTIKPNFHNNLEKFGLITKAKLGEILKEKRGSIKNK